MQIEQECCRMKDLKGSSLKNLFRTRAYGRVWVKTPSRLSRSSPRGQFGAEDPVRRLDRDLVARWRPGNRVASRRNAETARQTVQGGAAQCEQPRERIRQAWPQQPRVRPRVRRARVYLAPRRVGRRAVRRGAAADGGGSIGGSGDPDPTVAEARSLGGNFLRIEAKVVTKLGVSAPGALDRVLARYRGNEPRASSNLDQAEATGVATRDGES